MEKLKAQIGLGICSFCYFFISSFIVQAAVTINELVIQPNQAVELYNSASISADISGWYIDDAGGTTYFTVPQQTILAPLACYVFTSDFNFNKATADTVRLFDNSFPPITSSAKLFESYSYTKAPDSGYAFIKKIDGGIEWQMSTSSLGLFNETLTSCIPSPTPTPFPTEIPTPSPSLTPTIIPSPTLNTLLPTPSPTDYSNIFLSEIYPYPKAGENEWVELSNENDFQVDLANWYIDDGENRGSTPKLFSLILEAHSYGVVELSSSVFNNSGDTVRLLDHNKTEKNSMEYGKTEKEKSIGRISFSEDTFCEQEPSKNCANSICISPTATPISQIKTETPAIVKKPIPVVKIIKPSLPQNSIANTFSISSKPSSSNAGVILGTSTQESHSTSATPYLSFVSGSYSLLTIVSILIKMKNA